MTVIGKHNQLAHEIWSESKSMKASSKEI